MPVHLPEGTVNWARGVEVEVWTLAGNDFTSYLNRLNCTATPHIGWAFFAPIIQPWTEARRELEFGVFEAWVGLVGREQFVIGTITAFPNFFLVVISGVAAKLGVESLTVVTLVGKPGASSNGKLFLRIVKTGIGDHPIFFNQVAGLIYHILLTVLGVWRETAFGK